MSIINITKGWKDLAATGGKFDGKTFEIFSFVTDDPTDTPVSFDFPVTVGGVTIPKAGTRHPDKRGYRCGHPQVSLVCPTFFNVRVNYSGSTNAAGEQSETDTNDPLSEPAEISWSDASSTEAVDQAFNGYPLVNTVGEPFDPPPTEEFKDTVLTITRNEAGFTPNVKRDYQDTVCNGAFWGAEAGRARMIQINADKVNGIVVYWRKKYVIQFRMLTPQGVKPLHAWCRRVLNHGFRYKDDEGKIRGIKDADGQPLSQPKLLALDGTLLKDDDDPVYLLFQRFLLKNWGPLGLNIA